MNAAVKSRAMQTSGGFFSLFELAPAVFKASALEDLSRAMGTAELPGSSDNDSGYVYLGQFITHDVTKLVPPPDREFVPTVELVQERTAALDLDSVYGDGFHDDTGSVDTATGKLALGRVIDSSGQPGSEDDLPRNANRTPLIGDKRNDENLLVAQLHVQFVKLHNYLVDRIYEQQPGLGAEQLFEQARRNLTLYYQEVVLYDFLRVVLDPAVWEYVIGANRGTLWNPVRGEMARMPLEFSTAAFRFAHAMVRPSYTINDHCGVSAQQLFDMTGEGGFGNRNALPETHIVDWNLFFSDPTGPDERLFRNKALCIDPTVAIQVNKSELLAGLDLRAGNRALLPDAQSIVRHIKAVHPDLARHIRLRALTPGEINPAVRTREGGNIRVFDLLGDSYGFETRSPLYYYVLAEAYAIHDGERLGPLGSLIVAETLRGLIFLSSPSILHRDTAALEIQRTGILRGGRHLRMTDLLSLV